MVGDGGGSLAIWAAPSVSGDVVVLDVARQRRGIEPGYYWRSEVAYIRGVGWNTWRNTTHDFQLRKSSLI